MTTDILTNLEVVLQDSTDYRFMPSSHTDKTVKDLLQLLQSDNPQLAQLAEKFYNIGICMMSNSYRELREMAYEQAGVNLQS